MNPYLKNILVLLAIIFTLAILLANNIDNNRPVSSDRNIIKIDSNLSQYLKEESKYNRVLYEGRNVVFYGEECSCPYSQKFVSKLESLRKTGKYRRYYSFVKVPNNSAVITMKDKDYEQLKELKENNPSIYNSFLEQGMSPVEDILPESKGKLLNQFYRNCGVFCIVNSRTDRMVKFNGVGNKEINQLEKILDKYNNKDW